MSGLAGDKPRLLDLFCGAGGATRGYQDAGFYVVGVDVNRQPHYCGDEFHQADAMTFDLAGFDAIHASPPCQAFTVARSFKGRDHPDLLTPMRDRLTEHGGAWVIENVVGAPMRADVMLCGSMFGLATVDAELWRHRLFESSVPMPFTRPQCQHGARERVISIIGSTTAGTDRRRPGRGYTKGTAAERAEAMRIDWMTGREMAEAIPPAFTEWIGRVLMDSLKAVA